MSTSYTNHSPRQKVLKCFCLRSKPLLSTLRTEFFRVHCLSLPSSQSRPRLTFDWTRVVCHRNPSTSAPVPHESRSNDRVQVLSLYPLPVRLSLSPIVSLTPPSRVDVSGSSLQSSDCPLDTCSPCPRPYLFVRPGTSLPVRIGAPWDSSVLRLSLRLRLSPRVFGAVGLPSWPPVVHLLPFRYSRRAFVPPVSVGLSVSLKSNSYPSREDLPLFSCMSRDGDVVRDTLRDR